jgi:hypothetical protein
VKSSKRALTARDVQKCERQRHPRYAPRSIFQKVFVPADGVKAAN